MSFVGFVHEGLIELSVRPSGKILPLLGGLEEARSASQSLTLVVAKKDQPERYGLRLSLDCVEARHVASRIVQNRRVAVR